MQKKMKENSDKVGPPPNTDGAVSLTQVFDPDQQVDFGKTSFSQCVKSIGLSVHNPVKPERKAIGDLLYIRVRILEGAEYVITAHSKGFYVNDSQESGRFNPNEITKINPCHSHSLVGLLYQLSAQFRLTIEDHVNSVLKTDPLRLTNPNIEIDHWLTDPNSQRVISSCEEANAGLHGLDPKQQRDWNEEFQSCKELPNTNIVERIQRDRAIAKVYSDFCNASRRGAVAVVDKALSPLNPQDPAEQ